MNSISRTELIRRLRKLGFEGPYSGGRHSFVKRGSLKLRIPNPHQGDIDGSLLQQIIKQAEIRIEQWDETKS